MKAPRFARMYRGSYLVHLVPRMGFEPTKALILNQVAVPICTSHQGTEILLRLPRSVDDLTYHRVPHLLMQPIARASVLPRF